MSAVVADISAIATQLDAAWRAHAPIDGTPVGAIGVDDAYRIQHELIALRTARGDRIVGVKAGFTSRAKMLQMGVESPIVGTLTQSLEFADGAELSLHDYIHPRIEPEVAFLLDQDVDLDASARSQLRCIGAVAPALEIIDSRFTGFSFTLGSVVADNTSAAGYAVGPWSPFSHERVIDNLAVRLVVGDKTAAIGSTAAILGDPLRVFPLVVDIARRHGFALPAGTVILAGAATAAVPLTAGLAEAHVSGLGIVGLRVTEESHA